MGRLAGARTHLGTLLALALLLVGCADEGASATATARAPTSSATPLASASPAVAPVVVTASGTPTAIASLTPSSPAPATGTPEVKASPPTPPAPAPLSSTPTLAPPPSSAGWPAFTDGRVGVSFRYPPACELRYDGGAIEVGPRIMLDVIETRAATLDAYVDELVRAKGWTVERRTRATLDGEPTARLEFRFGGTGRFGVAFFAWREGLVYAWHFAGGGGASECELPATFDAILGTFRLTDIIR